RGRLPLELSPKDAVAKVELPLVASKDAVPDVEGLVVDQEADDLAVGDVDHDLTGLRVAVAALRIGQRADLVEAVQIRPGEGVRLPLVEVPSEADVPVGESEERLRLRQHLDHELGLTKSPGLDGECGVRDHGGVRRSASTGGTLSDLAARAAGR